MEYNDFKTIDTHEWTEEELQDPEGQVDEMMELIQEKQRENRAAWNRHY